MISASQESASRRWALPFLGSLALVPILLLATILSSATASAAAQDMAEARVGASSVAAEAPVGPPEHITAGQRLGSDPLRVVTVVATGVAANTAARTCSFAGATTVLMADGSRKPIEDVRVGDKVIATDPETGEQAAKTVEHVFVHDDAVIDLVVDGEVITTTEDHPFWSVTDQRFERADELSPGEQVLAADGRVITVSGLQLGTAREALAYNLSVEGVHTYHVGNGEILVHNTCPPLGPKPAKNFIAPTNPASHPPSDLPEGFIVRAMPPTAQYPNGYWRLRNPDGHYVDPSTMRQPGNVSKAEFNAMTHVPYPGAS